MNLISKVESTFRAVTFAARKVTSQVMIGILDQPADATTQLFESADSVL
jgi:hypothetical protein